MAYYGLPMLFCLAVHWFALKTWFYNDDFAWLGLRLQFQTPGSLIHILFSPQAGGTVRTLSERLFFLAFGSIFGLEVAPFRAWIFLTQFATIALLMQVARRITGSAAAGFVSAILWTANAGLAEALGWTSAYNEIAEAFCILLALQLFLAYIDTGRMRYWIWQWVVFLLGFGVLELNVLYPALACGYALCCARGYLRKTLYLFIPSIFFVIVHTLFIPKRSGPAYQMYFDRGLFQTLWRYWAYATGALRDEILDWRPLWLGLALTVFASIGLAIFVYLKASKREWLPLLLSAWFVVILLPVLPFRNHFTEYYIMLPAIGPAILAGWAIASSKRAATLATCIALAGLYLALSITDTHTTEKFFYDRARRMKYLVQGLQSQEQIKPRRVALLTGIDNDLFWTGFCDGPFWLIGLSGVYLTPNPRMAIEEHPGSGCDVSHFFIAPEDAVHLLRGSDVGVFVLEGRRVRDVTASYRETAWAEFSKSHPGYVDVADPAYEKSLGPAWYAVEGNYRWMPKTATVTIHGPTQPGQTLEADGFCPGALLTRGPLVVTFRADGVKIGAVTLTQANEPFQLQFALPANLVGRPQMELEIEVSRTLQSPPDPRQLGLIFTTFTIK